MSETTVLVTLVRGAERQPALLHWQQAGFFSRVSYTLRLEWRGPQLQATAPDLFEALVLVRRQLEPQGWLVAVQGSRLDAYPSRMARDMGGGERIYVHRPGQPARSEDLVDTLAAAEPEDLATVAAQQQYWQRVLRGEQP